MVQQTRQGVGELATNVLGQHHQGVLHLLVQGLGVDYRLAPEHRFPAAPAAALLVAGAPHVFQAFAAVLD